MEPGTIVTISITWIVIIAFTGYYFVKVLRTPQEKQ